MAIAHQYHCIAEATKAEQIPTGRIERALAPSHRVNIPSCRHGSPTRQGKASAMLSGCSFVPQYTVSQSHQLWRSHPPIICYHPICHHLSFQFPFSLYLFPWKTCGAVFQLYLIVPPLLCCTVVHMYLQQ